MGFTVGMMVGACMGFGLAAAIAVGWGMRWVSEQVAGVGQLQLETVRQTVRAFTWPGGEVAVEQIPAATEHAFDPLDVDPIPPLASWMDEKDPVI